MFCEVCEQQKAWYQIYGIQLCVDCKKLTDKWSNYINAEADVLVLHLLKDLRKREPIGWVCLKCGFHTDLRFVADVHRDWHITHPQDENGLERS